MTSTTMDSLPSAEEISTRRRELDALQKKLDETERQRVKSELAARRTKITTEAGAVVARHAELIAAWEDAMRVRDEPRKRADDAEAALRTYERDIRTQRNAAGLCPSCGQLPYDRANLCAVCGYCGYRGNNYGACGFTTAKAPASVPPAPPAQQTAACSVRSRAGRAIRYESLQRRDSPVIEARQRRPAARSDQRYALPLGVSQNFSISPFFH